MIEIAIGFLGAYLARKAAGLLDRAGSDIDVVVDGKLGELYELVKGTLVRRGHRGERTLRILEKSPEDDDSQGQAADELEAELSNDPDRLARLQDLVAELRALDPTGIRLRGHSNADTIQPGGQSIGVDVRGPLQPGDAADGFSDAKTVGGEQIGVRYSPGRET